MPLYNYDRDKSGNPSKKCYIKNDGTMIGSTNCERCKYCIRSGYQNEASGTVGFIECTKNVDARIKPIKIITMKEKILYEIEGDDYQFQVSQHEPIRKSSLLMVSTLGWAEQYTKDESLEEIIEIEISYIKRQMNKLDEPNSGSMKGLKIILKKLLAEKQLILFA